MINTSRDGAVLTLRLNHGKVNALDLELLQALSTALQIDDTVRAVVLSGEGRAFSAGVDLKRILDDGMSYVEHFLPQLDETFRQLFACPVPVVAAINGHAIAGGCILAEACSYRLMADAGGLIGIPEMLVGVPFPISAIEILRYRLPPQTLEPLVHTGRLLKPGEARQDGLVDELVPAADLAGRAMELAQSFANGNRQTLVMTQQILRAPVLARMSEAASYTAATLERWRAADTFDSIRKFLERTTGR